MNHSQKIITKSDGIITNCASLVFYKLRWTAITNCDSFFITNCDTAYYKSRQVLQSAMDLLQIATGITKSDDYYKLRQYIWFWSKNGHFSNFYFLGNICQKNVFYHILERKNAFLGYKTKKFKKSKNWIFPKGLTHGFGPKMAILPTFFLGNMGQKSIFYDILERRNAFLGYKNKKLKNWKIHIFLKGVNPWFLVQKWPFFQFFFFGQYKPGKYLLRYSRTKKRLSRV